VQTPVKSGGLGKPARRRTTRAPSCNQDRNHASGPEAGRRSLTGLFSLRRDTLGDMVGESKDAKLLVLGARGYRGLERLLVGSLGHYCLSHAFCPVVSVPAPQLDQDKDTTDQPIGANASPTSERSEERRPCHHRLRWSVLAGQLASGP